MLFCASSQAIVLCFRLHFTKDSITNNTAAATVRQVVTAVFERMVAEDEKFKGECLYCVSSRTQSPVVCCFRLSSHVVSFWSCRHLFYIIIPRFSKKSCRGVFCSSERLFKFNKCHLFSIGIEYTIVWVALLKLKCSCGSVVEHCVSSVKVVGSIPREHMYWQKNV